MPGLSSLQVNIKDQPHNLAWINEREQALLKDLGGSGRPGPMGIPAYDNDDDDFDTDLDEDYDFDQEDISGGMGGAGAGAGGGGGSGGENVSPSDATFSPEDFTWSPSTGFTGPEKDNAGSLPEIEEYENETFQNIAGPDWKTPTTGPNAGKVTGDFIEVSPKSVNWNPGSPIAASIANILQAVLPGGTLAALAGVKLGDAMFGPGMVEVNHDGTPKDLDMPPDEPRDDGDDPEEEEIIEEVEEETPPPLGTMEKYFKDRENATITATDETNNIIDRLGIQNRTIEPFNEWLAGQSEAMRAADRTTQTNKYRESLVGMTSAAESYLPIVRPIKDRVTEQRFINNLYGPSAKRTSATQALFDELGI